MSAFVDYKVAFSFTGLRFEIPSNTSPKRYVVHMDVRQGVILDSIRQSAAKRNGYSRRNHALFFRSGL